MSKLDMIDLPRKNNQSNIRKFPFRSQSLRFNKKSGSSKSQQLIRQQSVQQNSISNNTLQHNATGQQIALSQLILKDGDLIISPFAKQSASVFLNRNNQSTTSGLTRHHSIKAITRSSSNQSISQFSNFIIGNYPTIQIQDNPVLDDNIFEDEGVVTNEESEDEDYREEDQERASNVNIRLVILNRHPRLGLGISVIGGCDVGIPVTIVGIKPGSPAQLIGDIYIGDQILSVNEVPINENTSHQDALKLLSKCGNKVSLILNHTKAVMNCSKKWKHRNLLFRSHSNNEDKNQINKQLHGRQMSLTSNPNDFIQNINSKKDDDSSCRINLFLGGISQYVSYGDKLRDSGFEIQANNERSIVVHCINKEICSKWFKVIKTTIDNLTNIFMQNFNAYYPASEHFFYMGFVSELITIQSSRSSSSLLSLFSSTKSLLGQHRWLPRYLIIKGGKIYLFKVAPTSTLLNYKRKIRNIFHIRSNSNGSSLGSVGSSTSEASNSSNSTSHLNNGFSLEGRPDRLNKLNKLLENELEILSIEHWICYNSDFQLVKPNEQSDDKKDCFLISSGKSDQRYFSTECNLDLDRLKNAWDIANYNSIIKNQNKIYTVTLEKGNIIGSLKIDWTHGFSFYDPKRNDYLWSYKFYQLKHSSDDGNDLLSLSFTIDPEDDQRIETHILRCSCLQTIIYCIHAFLRAKVYSLYL